MLSPYVRELSIGDIVRSSVRLYGKCFVPSFLSYLIPELPGVALQLYGTIHHSTAILVVGFLLLMFGGYFAYTGIILCISDACVGNTPSFARSFARGLITFGNLTVTSLLQGVIVVAGVLALIIPGVIFVLWFLYSPMAVILEGRTGWPALKRSKDLAKGFNMRNFGVLLLGNLLLLPAYFVGFIVLGIVDYALARSGMDQDMVKAIGGLGGALLSVVLYPLVFVLLVLTYYDLRARKEGYDSVSLEAELGR